jgi:hypothetical protein
MAEVPTMTHERVRHAVSIAAADMTESGLLSSVPRRLGGAMLPRRRRSVNRRRTRRPVAEINDFLQVGA